MTFKEKWRKSSVSDFVSPRRIDQTYVAMEMYTESGTNEFKIVFECASAIRMLADVLSNMLEIVELQVFKTEEFSGIMVEAIDSKQVCLVIAQLRADVTMSSEHARFCINTKTFNTCVKSTLAHYSISIESIPTTSSIKLVAYESLSNTSITRFTLPTLVCDQDPIKLKDQEYKYHIDMDTSTLKSIVRMCIALQGESLTFKVEQMRENAAVEKRPRVESAAGKHTLLTISSNGNCTQEHTFYSLADSNGSSNGTHSGICSEIASNPGGMDVVYEEVFGARHMAEFLKSIDRQTVTLRLSKELPLIINHKFGVEDSYVCLVVAPQVEE